MCNFKRNSRLFFMGLGTMRKFIPLILFFVLSPPLLSQQSYPYGRENRDYVRAMDLFRKQKYGTAQKLFDRVIDRPEQETAGILESAEYHKALCAVRLYHDNADHLLYTFIANHPESPGTNDACFEMARYYMDKNRYSMAVQWFERTDPCLLDPDEQAEYHFKRGYAFFKRKKYAQARTAFYEIKDRDTRYTSPAVYYYSHIAYEQKNFETALQGFLRLEDDNTFARVVPYYITQIYYLQEKYDKVIEYAPGLIEKVNEKRLPEMLQVTGEAYFQLDRYQDALPYLERYHGLEKYPGRREKYQLAFTHYSTGDYEKAAKLFREISRRQDKISQNALFHLGDSYLKLDDLNQARMAFSSASKMNFDPDIREDAMFNYALVTFRLSYSPFNEAIRAFNRYIREYPASPRTDQAHNFLLMAFMRTRNYKNALASIEKIRRKDEDIEKAYQRVAYFRGLELFKNLRFHDAINTFDISLKYGKYDPDIKALCYYWKGEAFYRLRQYDKALAQFNDFLLTSGSFQLDVYPVCHYNIGYIHFHRGNYEEANTWFRKFIPLNKDEKSRLIPDAFNRIGDGFFISSAYGRAIEYYENAINAGMLDVDYALFQKAISLGVMGNHNKKIEILENLQEEYPDSPYTDDALYEQGQSLEVLQKPAAAIKKYQEIIGNFPNSGYVSKAYVQLGLQYFNTGRNQEAIENYKKAVTLFPGTAEARHALTGLRNVYMEINNINAYLDFVESMGEMVNITVEEQDSLVYTSAENLYMAGNCERAIHEFSEYISRFEQGNFLINAHFYKAECHRRSGDFARALEDYNYVIRAPRNIFTEPALVSASEINYDLGNIRAALEEFLMLEGLAEVQDHLKMARIGKMRCYFELEEYGNTIDAARELMMNEKLSEELIREARFTIARSFYLQDRLALALEEFRKVSGETKSREGAESKYRVAEILYRRGETDEAEKVIFEFIEENTPHQYWMAKAFVLLSDIYAGRGDDFQAMHTLQSILDYYEETDDGILDIAQKKMNELKAPEDKQGPEQFAEPGSGGENNEEQP